MSRQLGHPSANPNSFSTHFARFDPPNRRLTCVLQSATFAIWATLIKTNFSHLLLLLSFYRIPPTLCSTRISTVYQRLCHSTIRMFYAHLTHFYQRPFGLPCSRLTKYVIPTLFRALFRLVVSVIISQCTKYHQRTKRFQ